ncbi:MAG TPA: [protein-PII] uridylyltransferase, partial [Polyangiales bacterium]|nr:[protein-PII] uridylyltransferase [Polyangiales bacterium]
MQVPSVKAYLDAHLRDLVQLFEVEDSGGILLAQRCSDVMDELLRTLYRAALSSDAGRGAPPILFAAVGGYGRRLLGWKSDLDVRLLTTGEPERIQPLAEAILYPLWDAGVSIGHQVITVAHVIDDATRDLPTATALLDFRPIAGDRSLERTLKERAFASVFERSKLPEFMRRLQAEARARRKRLDDSMYLLEPDVKNGAGGLRELDIGLWAAGARWQTASLPELCRLGAMLEREAEAMTHAAEFMWRVRNRLHRHAGRRSDRLTFVEQERISGELGYRMRIGALANASEEHIAGAMAEAFMSDYYRHARTITRASEHLCARATPRLNRRRPREEDIGQGVRVYGDSVTLSDPSQLKSDPALSLRLMAAAVARDLPIHDVARDAITRETAEPAYGPLLRTSPEAARLFISLVTNCKRARFRTESILVELHDVGLLTAMIPEFIPVVGRAHHDLYHVYTVDVHSVAAVDHLRSLVRGDLSVKQPLGTRLILDEGGHDVLFLATLLHDVGKALRGSEHSRRGAEMSRDILARLHFAPAAIDETCQLILEHLTMYRIAMRRDVEDPGTVADFARIVRTERGLRRLYLLTVADVCTTSPTSMTKWKAGMLDALYRATDSLFSGSAPADKRHLINIREELHSQCDASLDRVFLEEFLETMPERYLLSSTPAEIAAHARVAYRVRGESVKAALVPSRHNDVAELCVVTESRRNDQTGLSVVADDRPGLLAAITAAMVANRLDIHAAQIHSRQLADGGTQAVDLFWVRDPIEGAAGVARLLPKLERDLKNVLGGHIPPMDLLQTRKAPSWSERPTPNVSTQIQVDHEASPHHTVIEVLTKDQPGVLFTLAQAMHELGITIALAKISTEGARATDAFYVTEAHGGKLDRGQRS